MITRRYIFLNEIYSAKVIPYLVMYSGKHKDSKELACTVYLLQNRISKLTSFAVQIDRCQLFTQCSFTN
jgi:hypothetical protein